LQSDGRIVTAGYSYDGNTGFDDFAIVRSNSDGNLYTGFHRTGKVTTVIGDGNAHIYGIVLQADGRILAAGESLNGGQTVFTLARCFGSDQPPIVKPGAATVVTKTSAVLAGTVNPNSLPSTVHFEHGLDLTYGATTADQVCGNGTTAADLRANISWSPIPIQGAIRFSKQMIHRQSFLPGPLPR